MSSARALILQSRIHAIAITIAPLLGFAAAARLIWLGQLEPVQYLIFIFFYVFSTVGVELGYHRYFAHGAFTAPPFVELILGIAGAMTAQGSVSIWVGQHRRHHPASDAAGDPHSPRPTAPGLWPKLRGFYFGHVGWMYTDNYLLSVQRSADVARNPIAAIVDKYYLVFLGLGLALPALLGGLACNSLSGAWHGFLWGGLSRIFIAQHFIFGINSVAHLYGARDFESGDYSRNVWWMAVPTMGASWHNSHHAFPKSARLDMLTGHVDISGLVARLLARGGIISGVELPSAAQRAAKLRRRRQAAAEKR